MSAALTKSAHGALVPAISMDEFAQVLEASKDYITTGRKEAIATAVARVTEKRGFLARRWPTPLERSLDQISARELDAVSGAQEQAFKLCTDIMLQHAKMVGEGQLARLGMQLTEDLTNFATASFNNVSRTVLDSQRQFLAEFAPELRDIERYKDDPILEPLYRGGRKALEAHLETYWHTNAVLLNSFVTALQSKISG